MTGMRNNDRRTPSDRNEIDHPRSNRTEPTPRHELEHRILHLLSDKNEMKEKLKDKDKEIAETSSQLVIFKEKSQTFELRINLLDNRVRETEQLFSEEQQKYEQVTHLYQTEQARAQEFLAKYEEADAERSKYLLLYQDVQGQLIHERRSKAGIKGWETRRKKENERLKKEIGEMTVLLRDSLARKDAAINNLYILAERMDRIQDLMDSVEEESDGNFFTFPQKLKRIWSAIKDILSE
jgi:chromosome segregation ATPase